MSDADETILSTRGGSEFGEEPQQSDSNRLLIGGGIGCALLLCIVLLVGGYFYGDQLGDLTAGASEPEVAAPTEAAELPPTEPVEALSATPEPTVEPTEPTVEPTAPPTEEPTPTPTPEPAIGEIVFALGATDEYEPIQPDTQFEGEVTEVHAIFEYTDLSPAYTWERVWFLDGTEMLRSSEPWSGAEAGVFDYFINAGGEPLSPGEWVLELYVEDELRATGSFVIVEQSEETAETAATEEPEAVATTEAETTTEVETTVAEDATREFVDEAEDTSEHDADVDVTEQGSEEAAATSEPTAASASEAHPLAYTKWTGVQHDLYVSDTNGSTEQFILGRAAGPSWSPDGSTIFFFGESGVNFQEIDGVEYPFPGISDGIVALTASPLPTGMDQVELFQGLDWKDGQARWANVSPNGQMVAFDSDRSGAFRIYFLGTAANEQFRFEIIGEQADWSPDSERIVYRSGRNGITGIWISSRNDTGHTLITNGGSDSFPAWSPDGSTIAFSRDVGGNIDIYKVDVDGSNLQRLTDAPSSDTLPEYTPDGEIVFRSARSGQWGIWKMNGDGTNQTLIVPDADVGPDWAYSRMSVLP